MIGVWEEVGGLLRPLITHDRVDEDVMRMFVNDERPKNSFGLSLPVMDSLHAISCRKFHPKDQIKARFAWLLGRLALLLLKRPERD